MVSITRCCARLFPSLVLALCLAPGLAGCGLVGGQQRFEVSRVDVRDRGGAIDVQVVQSLKLSPAARRAIANGVPLILEWRLEVRDSGGWAPVAVRERRFEIRYLPMSRHFQLVEEGRARTFPRLRHVLRELSELSQAIDEPALGPGEYELRTRMRLDRASLPAPVQLPSLVSRAWRHDSEWSRWPFTISA